jgi:DNA-directed RNA polymerase subunit RPC12/RpoP
MLMNNLRWRWRVEQNPGFRETNSKYWDGVGLTMSQKSPRVTTKPLKGLRCEECGNTDLFIEVMAHESHIVDGQMNYLHLFEAEVDRYECRECGEEVEWDLETDGE